MRLFYNISKLFPGAALFLASVISYGQIADRVNRCKVVGTSGAFERWLSSKQALQKGRVAETYKIPVVVHVVHSGEEIGEGFNISDEQILSQIRVINEDFRRKEGTRGFNAHPDGGDAMIEFVMAQTSPDGKPTNGIVRVNRNSRPQPPFGGSMLVLGAYYSIWNPDEYLNIWAVPGILDTGLGEARFPQSDLPGLEGEEDFVIPGVDSLNGVPVNEIDGVAINALHFGETNTESVYNLGRTGTHEIGHFLGLFHPWGDEGFEGSCDIDDYCDDTPPTDSRTTGCPDNKTACDGRRAMIENFMDYTDDACMNIFTNDQIRRMRTVLEHSPRRKSLLTSRGLAPPDIPAGLPLNAGGVKIHPNPATSKLTIELADPADALLALYFYDLSGSLLSKTAVAHGKSSVVVDVPAAGCSVALLKVVRKTGVITKKVVVRPRR